MYLVISSKYISGHNKVCTGWYIIVIYFSIFFTEISFSPETSKISYDYDTFNTDCESNVYLTRLCNLEGYDWVCWRNLSLTLIFLCHNSDHTTHD